MYRGPSESGQEMSLIANSVVFLVLILLGRTDHETGLVIKMFMTVACLHDKTSLTIQCISNLMSTILFNES